MKLAESVINNEAKLLMACDKIAWAPKLPKIVVWCPIVVWARTWFFEKMNAFIGKIILLAFRM